MDVFKCEASIVSVHLMQKRNVWAAAPADLRVSVRAH